MIDQDLKKRADEALRLMGTDPASSKVHLDKLILDAPGFAIGYCMRGIYWHRVGERTNALSDYERAISLDPGYARAIVNRGVILFELGSIPEAFDEFDKAISINPEPLFFFHRGRCYLKTGQFNKAIGDFDFAISQKSNGLTYLYRGITYLQMGNPEGALDNFNACLSEKDGVQDAWTWKVAAQLGLGDCENALATASRALSGGADSAEIYFQLGLSQYYCKKYGEAIVSFKEAVDRDSSFLDESNKYLRLAVKKMKWNMIPEERKGDAGDAGDAATNE